MNVEPRKLTDDELQCYGGIINVYELGGSALAYDLKLTDGVEAILIACPTSGDSVNKTRAKLVLLICADTPLGLVEVEADSIVEYSRAAAETLANSFANEIARGFPWQQVVEGHGMKVIRQELTV